MILESRSLSPKEQYHLLTACVVPRPIAWVTSLTPAGVVNAAPFSFFNAVSTHPPIIMISVGRRAGDQKDTSRNIHDSGEFVVNVVDEDLAKRMNVTAGDYPPGASEIEAAGLTLLPSHRIKTPGIGESPIQLECVVGQSIQIGNSDVIFGEVLTFRIRDSLMVEGRIDARSLKAIGRLSGSDYCAITDVFQMKRPG